MAEVDFLSGRGEEVAVKSFFMRKAPFGNAYALLGGITAALRTISDLRFDQMDFVRGALDMGLSPEFVDFLRERKRLQLEVFAPREGSIFLPNEPIVTLRGPLPDIRLGEGIITEAMNFSTLSLTKWYRLVRTVRPGTVLEFARRRAQNHAIATLMAALAGVKFTSNDEIRRFFALQVIGTMGHEYIQGFGDVFEAFDAWLTHKPDKPVGLIDTKQTMEHDFPLWLKAVLKHKEAIKSADPNIWGWRNDSGDLAYLTIEQYRIFMNHELAKEQWFKDRMRIVLTNDLDEYAADEIIRQIRSEAGQAGLNAEDILRRIIWAAGTKPGTCADQSSLGGVAKLMETDGLECIKLAFDAEGNPGEKTSIPGFNRSALISSSGEIKCCLIFPDKSYFIDGMGQLCKRCNKQPLRTITACHPNNPGARMEIADYTATYQQELVFSPERGVDPSIRQQTIFEVSSRVQAGVDRIHWSSTRINKPHLLKVSLTPDLFDLRQRMISEGALRADFLSEVA